MGMATPRLGGQSGCGVSESSSSAESPSVSLPEEKCEAFESEK
jgi:hypothetical protein